MKFKELLILVAVTIPVVTIGQLISNTFMSGIISSILVDIIFTGIRTYREVTNV